MQRRETELQQKSNCQSNYNCFNAKEQRTQD